MRCPTATPRCTPSRTFTPDLVVLDLMLPGMSGFELCGLLRRHGRTPIIILSARGQKADKLRGLNLGADDYVSKPFDLEEFLARVRAVLRRARPVVEQLDARRGDRRFPRPAARARTAGRSTSRIANSSCSPISPSGRNASSAGHELLARGLGLSGHAEHPLGRPRDRPAAQEDRARRPPSRASSTPFTATVTASRPPAPPSRCPTRSAEIQRPRRPRPVATQLRHLATKSYITGTYSDAPVIPDRRIGEHSVPKSLVVAAAAAAFLSGASPASADPMACSLTGYKAAPGLTAAVTGDTLAVTWDGAKSQQLRLRFEIAGGTPTIRELAIRRTGGTWTDAGLERHAGIPHRLRPAAHEQPADAAAARARRRDHA